MATTFRLPPELHDRAVAECKRRGCSLNALVASLLLDYLDTQERNRAIFDAHREPVLPSSLRTPTGRADSSSSDPLTDGPPGRLKGESKIAHRMRVHRWKEAHKK